MMSQYKMAHSIWRTLIYLLYCEHRNRERNRVFHKMEEKYYLDINVFLLDESDILGALLNGNLRPN